MEKNKFISLFHKLKKEEVTAFGKYLRTAKSQNRIALAVFEKAKKAHPEMVSPTTPNWDKVALKIFPSEDENILKAKKKLSNTFHDLHLWLKEFLFVQKANDKSLENEIMWLGILKEKGMTGQYKKGLQKLFSAVLEKQKTEVTDYLHDMVAGYYLYETSGRVTEDNLPQVIGSLENFYQLYRQKLDCEILNWQKQNRGRVIERSGQKNIPLLNIYRNIYALISGPTDKNFQLLFDELKKENNKINRNERFHIYQYLKNFSAQKLRQNKTAYLTMVHELDKFAVDNKLFDTRTDRISATQFLNIVSVAGAAKEGAWARNFVKNNIHLLGEEARSDCRAVAELILMVKKGMYKKAIKHVEQLGNYQSKDLGVAINHRLYELIVLYELNEDDDLLFKKITNFNRFVERQRKAKWLPIVATKNFLFIFHHLVFRKNKKHWIIDKIRAANPLFLREWLLEKVELYKVV